MKKVRRVTENREFGEILSCRKFSRTPSFVLYRRPAAQNHARIGISAGKKLGNAVIRNRVKRQVRAMIDEVFTFEEPYDFVLIVKPGFLKKEFSDLKRELAEARKKALQDSEKRGKKC